MPVQQTTRTLRPRKTAVRQHDVAHRNPKPTTSTKKPSNKVVSKVARKVVNKAVNKTSNNSKHQVVKKPNRTIIRRFRYFKMLPVELRFRIYSLSLQERRIIHGYYSTEITDTSASSFLVLYAGPVPTLLGIDSETRTEALKSYTKVQKYITFAGPAWKEEVKIWIAKQDIVYFTAMPPVFNFTKALIDLNKQVMLTQIAFGMFETVGRLPSRQHPDLMRDVVQCLPNLKKVVIVSDYSQFRVSKEVQKYSFAPLSTIQREQYGRELITGMWTNYLQGNSDWVSLEPEILLIRKAR